MDISSLLLEARMTRCSDVHISEGLPLSLRRDGRLILHDYPIIPEEARTIILSMLSESQKRELESGTDLDFAWEAPESGRFRVNVYRHKTGLAAAIRLLSDKLPTLESLSLPPVLAQLADMHNGLVLITGPTGSGKSTTLAAMIDYITRTRSCHILTVEDPIEYVFDQNLSLVHQREVGSMAESFASALRSALREDPDVILVGEMRDYETISTAVTAAETGHLVLSTLHTTGAAQTIDRIIDTCPPESQQQMRGQLSMILRGVVTQQLLPISPGPGRIAATEILIGTDAVGNLIRDNKCHQIMTSMQSGAALGMHSMNSDLARLVQTRMITRQLAIDSSSDKKDLLQYLN